MTSFASMNGSVRILSSVQEITPIADAWEALAAASGCPIDAAVWCKNAYLYAHPSAVQVHVVTVWDSEILIGVLPLLLTHGSTRRYEIVGSTYLYEPVTVLASTAAAGEMLARAIASLKHPVSLARLRGASEFILSLARYARGSGWLFFPKVAGSPYVELCTTWENYHDALPSRLKNVVRRGQRQLSKQGKVEVQFLRPGPSAVGSLLTEAFEVELRGWKGRAGSAVLMRANLREFFFHYAADLAQRNQLLVSFLRLDGAVLAMQVAAISHNAYWQLKIGYDERYAKQLVGLQLQLETIKWSCQEGLQRYEFLGTTEPWIREWTRTEHDYQSVLFYPCNVSGFGALARNTAQRIRDKLTRRWRPRAKSAGNSLQ